MALTRYEKYKKYIELPGVREKKRTQENTYNIRIRKAAIEFLGGNCTQCGFSDVRALQIDHINGGGAVERRTKIKNNFSLVKDVFSSSGKYQLLCANCNVIKRVVN